MDKRLKETEVAKAVVEYMRGLGWEIYQEVQLHSAGAVADIVGVRGNQIWVVETKTALNLDVIAQANHWRQYAHWVSVGVPASRRDSRGRLMAKLILRERGIGFIIVEPWWGDELRARESITPRLWRHRGTEKVCRDYLERIQSFRDHLEPEHKTFTRAGSRGGRHWTPWQSTIKRVREYVEENPGLHVKALIDALGKLHYATDQSARSSISYWVQHGYVDGVRCEREGRYLRLYPESGAKCLITK